MNKYIVSSLLSFLLLAPAGAFAQFKVPAQAAANLTKLDRLVTQAARFRNQAPGVALVRVPANAVPGGRIVLQAAPYPAQLTPVNRSLRNYIERVYTQVKNSDMTRETIMLYTPHVWGARLAGQKALGKGYYTDQSALARDLDRFYSGEGETRVGADGREVRFYALPVDGILYQPAGYKHPVVLNSAQHFVIFDTQSATGKLAQNSPQVYEFFKPLPLHQMQWVLQQNHQRVQALRKRPEQMKIWELIGAEKAYYAQPVLAMDVAEFYYQEAHLSALKKSGFSEEERQYMLENKPFNRLPYTPDAPLLKNKITGKTGYVYEIPVDGLLFYPSGIHEPLVVDPEFYVVFHPQGNFPELMERSVVQDPRFFELAY